MHRRSFTQWMLGGLGLVLSACVSTQMSAPTPGAGAVPHDLASVADEMARARAQLPERLQADEADDALLLLEDAPAVRGYALLARTSNPHVSSPRGGVSSGAPRVPRQRGTHPRAGAAQGTQATRRRDSHHHGHSSPRPPRPDYQPRQRVHRDGWGRGMSRNYGAYRYYPVGNYLFPYYLGVDAAYYPYSGLDYPYFYWRDNRWWPAHVPSTWNLGTAADNRTWVVLQAGRLQPELVTLRTSDSLVFFNAETSPQRLLIEDSAGAISALGPINPGEASQVVTFPLPGRYRFSNPDRPGTQGWVTVN